MTRFVSDSSCDLTSVEGVEFGSVALNISTAEKTYTDDENIDIHEMLDYLTSYKGRSYTACPDVESWIKQFEGADKVYVATMTSALSGTYNSALIAKDIYQSEHPETQIEVFDTLSTGPELRLFIEKLIELDNMGLSFEEVCSRAREYLATTGLYFAFVSLHNFAQNGRVSKVVASAINVMGISVIGRASREGTVEPITKCRGEKKVIANMINEMEKDGYKGGKVRICHVENEELAVKVSERIKEKYPDADILVYQAKGICSYYGERGGIIIGCEY